MFSAGSCFSWDCGARAKLLLSGCRTRRHAVIASGRAPITLTADIGGAALTVADCQWRGRRRASCRIRSNSRPIPIAVVREADRVLAGEGHLIVLGFRPFSLWGFRSRAISRGYPPGLKRMLGARRVADWLELLGYDVVADTQLSVHAALGRQRRAGVPRRCCAGLDQALAGGRVSAQGAQARLHADADPSARASAQPSADW